jgi:hypothetical protein
MRNVSIILVVPWFLPSCATPIPNTGDHYRQVSQTYKGLQLDLDLLVTSKLSQDKKQDGEKLLNFFYSAETSLTDYIDALEKNLAANDQLKNKYTIADSIAGGLAGLSSPAIIFATAAVAIPIAGVTEPTTK